MKSCSSSVAIVGIGGIYPDAPDLDQYWANIRDKVSASREVPEGRWRIAADAAFDPAIGAADKVYSRRGCFLGELPSAASLPGLAVDPRLLEGLDPLFHLLIHAGKRAFDDGVTAPLDRSRIGVIIGNLALPSETSSLLTANWLGRTFQDKLLGHSHSSTATSPFNRYVAGLPAGILAQALGINGGGFTLDAACASSLYAIKLAIDELLSHRADAMLTGGLSRPDPLFTQMGFSQLRALSKRGICSPFDAAGDGLVVGEGCGIFLLKRLDDAIAHGDRIYGIIKGIGLSNDVGGSLLAPMSEGQLRAMRSAYARAGWNPGDVDLIECHATGTPVGDATEVASLRELWNGLETDRQPCVIGSVKSNIGHLLTAAGAAALTKVLLAMRAETLPPTANFATPQPGMQLEKSPFRVLDAPQPWQRRSAETPRRAAVSAFGFGGINAHLLVEEWISAPPAKSAERIEVPCSPGAHKAEPIAVVGLDARFGPWQDLRAFQERVLGGDNTATPEPPGSWWGAQASDWFRQKGLDSFPFNGFYVDQVAVAANQFRIPPKEMEEMLPQQLLMLQTAAGAMEDAGAGREGNSRTGVFIGIALDLNSTNFSLRWSLAEQAAVYAHELGLDLSEEQLAAWTNSLRDASGPALTANRTMGALGSVVASRIAREYQIGGPSFTLSSEESSGVRALETAVHLLRNRELDKALVGAVDLAGDLRAMLGQHALLPFSATGRCLPFDQRADGTIAGEGATAFVLKRLEDAERDNDRIYAVIRGIGSSNGETRGSAPYLHALERAYAEAGIDPAQIDYLETGACGNPEADRQEAVILSQFFGAANRGERSCAVGSVKGDIGHTGAVSGLASLARTCLALHQEIIPGCRGIEEPLRELSGPLFVPSASRYWLLNRADGPRRAGVSVCGVDGSCSHVVMEGWEKNPPRVESERTAPLGYGEEFLFALSGATPAEVSAELDRLQQLISKNSGDSLGSLAFSWFDSRNPLPHKPLAMAMVARSIEELDALIRQGRIALEQGAVADTIPALRDRLFYSADPLALQGTIAFVFPGSGNHYPGMSMELSSRWPQLFRRQHAENLLLRSQFQPELFWNNAPSSLIDDNHRAVIFGQVATGCIVSDAVRSFGVHPAHVIGYSLGESAALFSQRAWTDRDGMYSRMQDSTLFTHDLAGECRAARTAWGMADNETVRWSIGVADAPEAEVRRALADIPRAYLLIINTPHECVIGGDSAAVEQLVSRLDCRFFPLSGVTTVHCEVARPVADAYHDLHLFPTNPPADVTFYSGAKGGSYRVTRESAADAILAQALEGINYPATIESAYQAGVRLFLEMGPGASCSRMISRILDGRPHLARSACYQGQEPVSTVLRMLAHLISEGVEVDLSPLFDKPRSESLPVTSTAMVRVKIGGAAFQPMMPILPAPVHQTLPPPLQGEGRGGDGVNISATTETHPHPNLLPEGEGALSCSDTLLQEFSRAQQEQIKAHEAFLSFSDSLTQSMAQALALEMSLRQALGDDALAIAADEHIAAKPVDGVPYNSGCSKIVRSSHPQEDPQSPLSRPLATLSHKGRGNRMPSPHCGGGIGRGDSATPHKRADEDGGEMAVFQRPVKPCTFDRNLCLEFARGSVARMLGPQFAEVDSFPTRVRLPDEPLMLVDRIMTVEGEARSMTSGRVVTEHDVLPGAWYLDGGRIPTCIAVEAGQADLFLSGYLGIDFITRGLAVYRLLDAVVTFHRGLPQPGETIHYDIHIERFFRQGDTYLFRFFFEATVDGQPLLSMRDGCAGFFSAEELDAGKGIVRPALDLRPTKGIRPADWQELVPMYRESYDAAQLDLLRQGDLAGCFGTLFSGLPLSRPLTIPGGTMRMVHRVIKLDPQGGRCSLGIIRAEADIRPDDWFLTCHFVDDRVMPGTLMYECCMHTLRIYLLRMGWVAEGNEAVWEPVPGVASKLCCRGQVLETTKVVTYEVTIREIGYCPEPYVIVDALMYADGKPIVEISSMSARLSGTTREKLEAMWNVGARHASPNTASGHEQGRGIPRPYNDTPLKKPAIYTKEQILAYSNGKPSEGFGEPYRIFDSGRKIARLPGPPFQFMDRVTAVKGAPWQMTAGAMAEAQYDTPSDAWFFGVERQGRMPFSVLLEAALQPCGWLAAYVGSALTSPSDISFRNLGGSAVQYRPITPESGTLTAVATLKKAATSGGMIIQEFDFSVADQQGILYEGDTMFGFFSKEALANQVGIRDAKPYQPTPAEVERGRSLPYPDQAPFPDKQLRMIDRIEMFVADGGPQGLGYIRGTKDVDPDEWFFKAHFFEDPVTPGSLGLESFLQLVKFAAVERWGWQQGDVLECVALEKKHNWLYRGQIVPTNKQVTVQAWITAVDEQQRIMTAAGFLSVDGKMIYQMNDFTVSICKG
ncbi:type I polyketide synthase [Pelotalea chapellei]|uniref:type I polyketide synthase n=1 Tax=Pelotalea chapellei TaxID=44671 RepID=UPI001FE34874|nr:type I polyketide synthase [Pelotalea chapellei]